MRAERVWIPLLYLLLVAWAGWWIWWAIKEPLWALGTALGLVGFVKGCDILCRRW